MFIKENLLKSKLYRPEIDGLRAFAVISVIINHFNKDILPGGYLGVDIFFVISGFVITSSLYKRPSKNFTGFIFGFYKRRIKRLVPALSLFVLFLSVLICFFHQNHILSLRTGFSSLFGLSNLYLIKQTTNYFAESTELNVFAHTWSLGVEEQFYILFPFLIWFSGFGNQKKNGERNLLLIIGTLSISSFIGFIFLYSVNQTAAYFLMPTRFWEIASGSLLFLGLRKETLIKSYLEKIPPFFVFGLIICVMFLPVNFGVISYFLIVSFTSILIICLKKKTAAYKLFTNSKVVFIGLISYSLYLWHWGVLAISRWTIGIHWWSIPLQIGLIFILSLASYKWIEIPFRKSNWLEKKLNIFLLGGGLIISVACTLIALEKPLKGKLFMGSQLKNVVTSYPKEGECFEGFSNYTNCFYIDNKSKRSLWVVGDSHASVLLIAAEKSAKSQEMNLKLFTSAGTPFPPVKNFRESEKIKYFLKNQKISIFDRFISNKEEIIIRNQDFKILENVIYEKVQKGDLILISMRLPYYFGGSYYEKEPQYLKLLKGYGSYGWQDKHFQDWISSVKNLADKLRDQKVNIIVQTPTPEWEREKNKFCNTQSIQWFNTLQLRDCKIESSFFNDKNNGIYKKLLKNIRQLALSRPNIKLLDSYSIVCPDKTCSFSKNGIDLFQDDNHFSMEAAKKNNFPSTL